MGSISYLRYAHGIDRFLDSPKQGIYRLPFPHPVLSRCLRHLNRGLRPLAAAPPIGYCLSTNTENLPGSAPAPWWWIFLRKKTLGVFLR